jgi:hypothetical protein
VVGDPFGSFLPRTVGAAVDRVRGFGTMADDPTSTMGTDRCQLLNSAFEAIEDVPTPGGNDLESEVVVVAADFADRHSASLGGAGSVAALSTRLRSEAAGRQRPSDRPITCKRLHRTHVPQLAIGGLCAGGAALRSG